MAMVTNAEMTSHISAEQNWSWAHPCGVDRVGESGGDGFGSAAVLGYGLDAELDRTAQVQTFHQRLQSSNSSDASTPRESHTCSFFRLLSFLAVFFL